jgi:DUF4097 and DUF4098 domain-containing protein YvlB
MKTLKKVVAFIFLMGVFTRLTAQTELSEHVPRTASQPNFTQDLVVPLSEPGKPVTLETHLLSGTIKVIGYDGKDVVIQIRVDSTKENEDRDDDAQGMKRIGTTGGLDIRAEEHDNVVRINSGSLQNKQIWVTIKVPHNTAKVDVGSVNGGDVEVSDVSGKIEISNVNGAIRATGISGSVVANTVNGDVIVRFKSVDASASMAFSSLSGKIDVTLPADTKANLKLKSGKGDIFSDFDVDVDKSQPKLETRNEDHYHEIKIDEWVHGKINGGGQEIMMQSTFGSIYIRNKK